ncbi:PTS glucose/sucrose transporter subunit IIB [Brevibacterium sp. JSBI002]|uniref:PTS glucose/sucrose transporter subunit IIB n=1 Tax=Brevibacterium sp. JSBI002 TaxID=2886045 RepID=UPI002231EA28|nr:PTS glucose/sucrose transporter subunit IIB [Brevibacterium sp. JSBI002]UZD61327.1 PTS glucose/sucrose transporter subunit IIB [Brevibacterium sp. JSBI002]
MRWSSVSSSEVGQLVTSRRRLVTQIAEREIDAGAWTPEMKVTDMDKAAQILAGLGGADNIDDIEACITRLRVEVDDDSLVNEQALTAAGAFGVVVQGSAVQVVVGPEADNLVDDIEDLMG